MSTILRLHMTADQRRKLVLEGRRYRMSVNDLAYAIVARTLDSDIVSAVIDEQPEG